MFAASKAPQGGPSQNVLCERVSTRGQARDTAHTSQHTSELSNRRFKEKRLIHGSPDHWEALVEQTLSVECR